MLHSEFNRQIKQLMILSLLLLMIFITIKELYVFFPGLLGALTLYILSRGSYFQLVYHRKWRRGWTAGLYLFIFFLLPASLVYIAFTMVEKQIAPFLNDPSSTLNNIKAGIYSIQREHGITIISGETLTDLQQKLSNAIPRLVNDTANLLANQIILLFVLYYMLVHGKEMEAFLTNIMPLKKPNTDLLVSENKRIVKTSALGIPLISIIQGLTSAVGYVIFGVDNFVLWGFLTGVLAFFPIVGTMIIWVPIVIYMYASGDNWNATGLLLFSVIVTGNVDYLARITLLKRLGHIHPVVTVLGVMVGLGLFGFIGLIFGPLLVNYIILIFRIYTNEFTKDVSAR